MAEGVEVDIDDRAIITALNAPGRPVFRWRDEQARAITNRAINTSPVNSPLNAMHRGGAVGTYKASWGFDRVGSNGHVVRATIFNSADHADIVEFGRRGSSGYERFSWTRWGGEIRGVPHGTSGRPGKHILRNATNSVAPGGVTV